MEVGQDRRRRKTRKEVGGRSGSAEGEGLGEGRR